MFARENHLFGSAGRLIAMSKQIRLSPVPPKTVHEAGSVFS